ncbi:MAG: tetratricopeptide repeat protein [Bacteroidales bacterium]|nr:tetratricopeptide repeat protein [Bacteroidales bacterium]HPD94906.1 tetratricopeptide repeat protein [Tenuifilaceae bacterium]HRX30679.1 tetratricopeptide repeat protein [Tenuifilaceae bacterium]
MIKYLVTFLSVIAFSIAQPQDLKQQSEKQKQLLEVVANAQEFEKNGDLNNAISQYSKAATNYWVNGKTTEAKKYFNKALELSQQLGNTNAQKVFRTNLGMILLDEEKYNEALIQFEQSLEISRKQKNKEEIASTLINIANTYTEINQYSKALTNAEEANRIAIEINNDKLLKNSYSLLTDIEKALGNADKSAEYFSLYSAFSKKIQREEQRRKEAEAKKMVSQAQNQLSEVKTQKEQTEQELNTKKQQLESVSDSLEQVEKLTHEQKMQIDLLNKEKALKDATIKNQLLLRNIFIVIILFTIGIAALVTYYYIQKKKSNKVLEEQKRIVEAKSSELQIALNQIEKQNRDIKSSINYAQRIQQALLPTYNNLVTTINDAFVLFRPRETVSGDFFWFAGYTGKKILPNENTRHYFQLHNAPIDECGFIISAVDCTGHGVPGAFMSMIGLNLFDTLVRNGLIQPDLLLNEMHNNIRHLLKQEDNDSRDGMDMAVCNIKADGRTVEFAGAKNPVYYIANNELNVIKGDPVPVGGLQKEENRVFTKHTITIDSPTCFYIFSDGYIDQFGGENGGKFSSKRFKELLMEIHDLPMIQQQEILETKLEEWQGNDYNQIDDILVVGFRLTGKPFSFK